jgi:hypothetical protein
VDNHRKVMPRDGCEAIEWRGRSRLGSLFVKPRLPVSRHPSGWSGRRLIQRTRVRSVKLRPGEEFFSTIAVKPPLARLEARDYRVTSSGAMFRCMLIWRTITAADVTAFGASAKMEPPSAQSRAFDATCSAWLGRRIDTVPLGFHRHLPDFLSFSSALPHHCNGLSLSIIVGINSDTVGWMCIARCITV